MTALGVLPIVLSVIALTVSLFGFRDERRRDKRDTFLKIHENLISNDKQHGRQLIFEKISDTDSVNALTSDEYRLVNEALATYEALGLYMRRGYIEERDVMEMWAVPICRAWERGSAFLAHRQVYQGADLWPNYRYLAQQCICYLEKNEIQIEPTSLRPPVVR